MTLPINLKRLRDLRGAQGWTQDDLAQASGISGRTVQRVEAGEPPSPDTLRALAAAFDVHPNALRNYVVTKGMKLGLLAGWAGMIIGPGFGFASVWADVAAGGDPVMLGIYAGLWGCAVGLFGAATGWMVGRERTRFRAGTASPQ